MEWQADGSLGFRANNGKFIATKKSGHLYANAENIEDTSKFFFHLINRCVSSRGNNKKEIEPSIYILLVDCWFCWFCWFCFFIFLFFSCCLRPILVLKSDQGFVGYKSGSSSNKLECNKANYEAIQVERGPNGLVYFKGSNNRLAEFLHFQLFTWI